MFTGIVEELGPWCSRDGPRLRIAGRHGARRRAARRLHRRQRLLPHRGRLRADDWWEADVSDETFARTILGSLQPGRPGQPRAARCGCEDRLGGHLVQGHVDAVGEVVAPVPDLRVAHARRTCSATWSRRARSPSTASASPSSSALDDGFTVAVIPHTVGGHHAGRPTGPGDAVNLEVDVMAKYAERLLAGVPAPPPLTTEETDR